VSKPNNVVGDVHSGVAGLVDENTFIEPPEHLKGEKEESKDDAEGICVDKSGGGTNKVKAGDDCWRGRAVGHIGGERQEKEAGDEDTTEDVKVCKITFRNNNQTDKRAFNWAVQCLAIAEELKDCIGKVIL